MICTHCGTPNGVIHKPSCIVVMSQVHIDSGKRTKTVLIRGKRVKNKDEYGPEPSREEYNKFINTPSQKLADKAYSNCSADADTINADDGEDEDDPNYLGTVAMAECAQSLAFWFDCLDRCMKAGFFPKLPKPRKKRVRVRRGR